MNYKMENYNINLSIIIMLSVSFVASYYLTENISLKKNITNNMYKFYMALFMAFIMAFFEILLYYYFSNKANHNYLLLFIAFGMMFFGYKLYTLNFLDDKEFLLSMIEHHEHAIIMADAHDKYYKTNDPQLNSLIDNIKKNQTEEIDLMHKLLKKY